MHRPEPMDLAFAALVVMVSVAPVLTVPGWAGYGPHGEFSCSCGQYYVRYSDPTFGGDKPHVFLAYQGFQVDMVEVSDDQSFVNGLNVYSNFTTAQAVVGGDLVVTYTSPAVNFTKRIAVDENTVDVGYSFSRNVTAVLTFWRWYYASVGPFDRPVTRSMAFNGSLPFSVFGQGAVFNGSLSATPNPASAAVSGVQGGGLNKVTLTFTGRSVEVAIKLVGVRALAGAGVVEVASSNEAFPVIGVAMAVTYLGARSWVKRKK